jgi:type IX secretion system PorP/SprF family membrane protein
MNKILPIFLFILTAFFVNIRAQDVTFSQFYEMPLLQNPALAGVFTGDIRINTAYRDQWASVTVPYRTTALSIEKKFPLKSYNDVVTGGIQMCSDAAGDLRLRRTYLQPMVNYHKSLSDNRDDYLSLAIMGGPVHNQFDPTKMKMADQWRNGIYDPSNPTQQVIDKTGYSYWDASVGLCYSGSFGENNRFYIASGLFHFNKPKIAINSINSNVHLDEKWTINWGLKTILGDEEQLIFYTDLFWEGGARQILAGCMYGREVISDIEESEHVILYIGSFLRFGDALIPVIQFDLKQVNIGLSYDVNISKLRVASNWRGGLELTASYKGFLKIRNSTLDRVRCVRF